MTAYVLVIVLAAGGHHQSFAVGYPDQGSCLVAAERLRRNKKAHGECLKRRASESSRRRLAAIRCAFVDFGGSHSTNTAAASAAPAAWRLRKQ